jgi:hypothetical protein
MNCNHCGATLSLDDLTRPNCPYCKQVLPHHARAAEHAALVNRVLDERIRAQYPGTPQGAVPQIGYGMGAGLQNMQQFQQHQMEQGVKRAGWMMVVMIAVMVALVVFFAGIGVVIFALAA